MKIRFTLFLISTFFFTALYFFVNPLKYNITPEEESPAEALEGFRQFIDQRTFPSTDLPDRAWMQAFEKMQRLFPQRFVTEAEQWKQIGPHNFGGRTTAVAFNPLNPNTIYAGAASGGLWVSYTQGVGKQAWKNIPTGFPVLGVGSIAIQPNDTNTIYIATGEVYGYQNSIGGLSIRVTRGSYGIGILKTTNGGTTWTKSLDWSLNLRRGVQVIKFHPTDFNILYAGTSEGLFKTTNAGSSWTQIHSVLMTTDVFINATNPDFIVEACGNLGSTGSGIYFSSNAGSSWTKVAESFTAGTNGKTLLAGYTPKPNTVFASIGKGADGTTATVLAKSIDAGRTWTAVSTFDYASYQGWFAHFVVPHQVDSTRVLTAGVDVFKSVDGGVNMTRKSVWSAWTFGQTPIGGPEGPSNYSHADHHAFAVHPSNPNFVLLGNDGGIFKTTDFGESFAGLNGGYQTVQFYNTFSVAQVAAGVAIGGLQDNATAVYTDSLSWFRCLGGDGCATAMGSTSADTMIGSSQYLSLSRSSNKGRNWSGISPPTVNEAFNAPVAIAPSNSKIVFAAGTIIYKSVNAGTGWTALNGGNVLDGNPVLSIGISRRNPDTLYLTTAPNNGTAKVFFSSNGGTSFTERGNGLPNRYMVDIVPDPVTSSTVYVTCSGFGSAHLFKSTDAGLSWFSISDSLPDVPANAVCIDPLNREHLFLGNDLGVFRSTNGGETWERFTAGLPEAVIAMDLNISAFNRKLYLATHGNGAYTITIPLITGMEKQHAELVNEFSISNVYPNPANNFRYLDIYSPFQATVTTTLFNASAEIVRTFDQIQLSKQRVQQKINLDGLASGVYFIRSTATDLCTGKSTTRVTKVLVTR